MHELALFAGSGLGMLGTKFLGFRTVCAVERDEYRRGVLFQRQADGIFPMFPIWDNVYTFDAEEWRGRVDVVTAGVPCPKWSTARRGRGNPPDLLDETLRVVLECEPKYVLLECVSGFSETANRIRHALCPAYRVRGPLIVDSAELGCPSPRKRCWFLAYSNRDGESSGSFYEEVASLSPPSDVGMPAWWGIDPSELVRVPDGGSNRVDRLSAAGDGQIPAMAVAAWRLLGGPMNV